MSKGMEEVRSVDRIASWEKIIAFRLGWGARRWERVDFPEPGEPESWMKSLRGVSGRFAILRVVVGLKPVSGRVSCCWI